MDGATWQLAVGNSPLVALRLGRLGVDDARSPSTCWSSARIPTTSRSASAAPSRVHAARGYRVGLCDLTRGELGSQRHAGRAAGRSRGRARGARRRLAREPRLARRRHRRLRRADRRRRPADPAVPAAHGRAPVLGRSPSRSRRGERGAHRARCSAAACAGSRPTARRPWRPDWICYYFINDSAPRVVRRRRLGALRAQARGARLPPQPVRAGRAGAASRRG